MRIENWSVTSSQGLYDAPECSRIQLKGNVFGHPLHSDGKFVRTSNIIAVDGSRVTTHSGSIYILGEPLEAYVEYCREIGCHVPTPEEPLKV